MEKGAVIYVLPIYLFVFSLILWALLSNGYLSKIKPGAMNTIASSESTNSEYVSGQPERILVPSIGIDVEVDSGNYDKDNITWNVSQNKVNFAVMTDLPNNKSGNTVIYGHNSKYIFKNLEDVKDGDRVYIQTKNGHSFEYVFISKKEINPNDVSILESSELPQLILLTCKGLLNEKRLVLTFRLNQTE